MQDLFIELLQVTLKVRDELSRTPSHDEWQELFTEAQRQAVVGILLLGLERLPASQRPPRMVVLQWIGLVQQLETKNVLMTKACRTLCEKLEKDGFQACVLKGQANHRYYPEDMRNRRCCGDIDVWTKSFIGGSVKGRYSVRAVLEYVQSTYDMSGLCWLHSSHTDESGIPVEIHFRVSFMNEPFKNRKFQKHFNDIKKCSVKEVVDGFVFPVMKVDEDVIYQMNHIYRHLIDEGVGLRQVVDYYMLLKSWNEKHCRNKEETMRIVVRLGMKKFASALMYVLQDLLGMKEEYLLCPVSEIDGKFLLSEIMQAGNFGQTDPRMAMLKGTGNNLKFQVSRASRRFRRNIRFLTSYPGEVIWEPIVRLLHFGWKKLQLWKY